MTTTARDGNGRRPLATALLLVGMLACAKADVQGADVGSNGSGSTSGGGAKSGGGGTTGYNAGGFGGLKTSVGNGTPEGMGCNDLQVNFEKQTPTVVLLVDRSGSMRDNKYDTGTRWDVLKDTLLAKGGFLEQTQAEVRFGFATFTSTAAACPEMMNVDIKLGAYADISTLYSPLQPPSEKSDTPTAEAVTAVTAKLEAFTEQGPKYILLATDGEPDGCVGPRDPNCGQDASITAVQNAFKKGIRTFVIAIGNEVGADHLQALANAGAGLDVFLGKDDNWLQYTCNLPPDKRTGTYVKAAPATNAPTYRPADQMSLARDLKTIIGSVRTCSYMLKGKVTPGQESLGSAVLDGQVLIYQQDWKVAGDQQFELIGKACQTVQDDQKHDLKISFPCGAYTPPG
jgi:hypothetical protein